jgi:signal transduction histidine kinase
MQFPVGARIYTGLVLIALISVLSAIVIVTGSRPAEDQMGKLSDKERRMTAAAYEMEVNINGIGVAALRYLDTPDPKYRDWVREDEKNFRRSVAVYAELVNTPEEQRLRETVTTLYAEYKGLATRLMNLRDRQREAIAALALEIDAVERHVNPGKHDSMASSGRGNSGGAGGVANEPQLGRNLPATSNFAAQAAKVGYSMSNYLLDPKPRYRLLALQSLREYKTSLDFLKTQPSNPTDLRMANALVKTHGRMHSLLGQIFRLHDILIAERARFIELRINLDDLLDKEIKVLALKSPNLQQERAHDTARSIQKSLMYLLPLLAISILVVGHLLLRGIKRPLQQNSAGIRVLEGTNDDQRIAPRGDDEIEDGVRRFKAMVERPREGDVIRRRLPEADAELRHAEQGRLGAQGREAETAGQLSRGADMSAFGTIVAGVAHEVRNHLFAISSTMEAMHARFGEEKKLARYFEVLHKESERLLKLMGDLIEYGKPAKTGLTSDSMERVITSAVSEALALANKADVHLRSELVGTIPPVALDRYRLTLALRNLIENAVQHSPAQGEVIVRSSVIREAGEEWVQCEILDAGRGINQEDLPRVFEPFFARRPGGTGLGLSIVRQIVEDHHGSISAANRPTGGAVMTIRLPAQAEPGAN